MGVNLNLSPFFKVSSVIFKIKMTRLIMSNFHLNQVSIIYRLNNFYYPIRHQHPYIVKIILIVMYIFHSKKIPVEN